MNKAMLKDVCYQFCDAFGLLPIDVLVGAGGAMVMHGLREATADIDLSVSPCTFEWFSQMPLVTEGTFTRLDGSVVRVLTHPEHPLVDIHLKSDQEKGELLGGVHVYTQVYTYDFKVNVLNRNKDQQDIATLKAALGI